MSQAANNPKASASSACLPFASIVPVQLGRALSSSHDAASTPLDELIATGAATYELIRHLEDIQLPLRQAFEQLEKQFALYAGLAAE